jgi:hypothetical protein
MESVFEYARELFDSSHSYVYAIMSEIPLYLIEYAWLAVNRSEYELFSITKCGSTKEKA